MARTSRSHPPRTPRTPATGTPNPGTANAGNAAAGNPSPKAPKAPKPQTWHEGQIVEVTITDLSDSGDGVGRYDQRVVFVPDTVTGDRLLARLTQVKAQYAHGQMTRLLQASPHRQRPQCIVADKCGGCQWQHVAYQYQAEAKHQMVHQALVRIGQFPEPPLQPMLTWSPDAQSPGLQSLEAGSLTYRNKVTYPLGLSQSGQIQAGYYRKGSHRLVNLNQCPVQDIRLNEFLTDVKGDLQGRGWTIYNEQTQEGQLRHLSLRIGRRTNQVLLTLVSTTADLENLETQARVWRTRYPNLVGVCLNINDRPTNVIFGPETHCIAGRPYLEERFAGLTFQIRPETFFQIYTEQAEKLLGIIEQELQLQGHERILDAYCGVGTLSLPLARQVRQVIGIEVQAESARQAQTNAQINGIANVEFLIGAVEAVLPDLQARLTQSNPTGDSAGDSASDPVSNPPLSPSPPPDIVLLDPPRKGCDRAVLEALLQLHPETIVYVSCKPATLARDLKILCQNGHYALTKVQPADFFPQTSHVEAVAFLKRRTPFAPTDLSAEQSADPLADQPSVFLSEDPVE